jgi:hypothetical protein
MNHPLVMHDMARMRIADDIRQADRERLARLARSTRSDGSIDAVPFRERLARLFGTARPAPDGGQVAGA